MAVFSVSAANFDANGYVLVTWTDQTKAPDFFAWRVYRRHSGGSWEMIHQTTSGASNLSFRDYLAPPNKTVEYAVVQATGTSTITESTKQPKSVYTGSTHYWLLLPTGNVGHIRLSHVTNDSFVDEYEEETLLLIGRGRKLDVGEHWGVSGTLTVHLREYGGTTARSQYEAIKGMKENQTFVWLRNPFTDIWKVSLGNISHERIAGSGPRDLMDITIPYVEVG